MGVLNVTPDSFSDGGLHADHAGAIERGRQMLAEGADIIDVGGESTRPGSMPVDATVELERVVPVVSSLAASGAVVSVDTSKPQVAEAALGAGAAIVNDVTALSDPGMAQVCAKFGAGVVLMHMQGTPATMADDPAYDDVVLEIRQFFAERVDASNLDPATLCLDPGIGFGKTQAHNLALLNRLSEIVVMGRPVLIGASRKGFIAGILEASGRDSSVTRRDIATAATTALAVAAGAAVVRVHDVPTTVDVARTADAIVRAADEERKTR